MKRLFLMVIMVLVLINTAYGADQWDKSDPAGTESPSDIDSLITTNNSALDRLLIGYVKGADVAYASATTVTVSAGEAACSNSAGSIVRWRRNTSSTNVTFSDLDTGSEAAGVYYVYAVADTDATTFTCTISSSSTAPTGKTYYKRLGYFTNDGSLDITASTVVDDDGTAVGDGSITTAKLANLAVTNAKIAETTIDLTAKVTGVLPVANGGTNSSTAVNTANGVVVLDTSGYVPDNSVDTGALKTNLSEVSSASGENGFLAVTGGSYCFWPQIKCSTGGVSNGYVQVKATSYGNFPTDYATYIAIGLTGGTGYAQFRYVTSSGTDDWIWLLIDKDTKEVLSASASKDHPSYGNGGESKATPHPFSDYYDAIIPNNLEIILLNKEACSTLEQESKSTGKSILTLLNEDYFPDMNKIYNFEPLHSGKYIDDNGKVIKQMINDIPGYVRVRGIKKLTESEKASKKVRQEQLSKELEEKAQEEALITQEQRKQAISALKTSGKELKHITE